MLRGRVAILFLEVARRSPWCRGTPAHVHWSLLRCPPDDGGGGGGGGGNGGDGFSSLRFFLPKRQGERRCTPLPRVLLFHPSTRRIPHLESTTSPPRGTTFPFVPAAPSGRRRRGEMLPLPLIPSSPSPATADTATTIVFSSNSLPPPTATIPPIPPSCDIITPFYSRFIGLYQLHCHRTVCIVAAWLPDCRDRVAHVPRLRSAPASLHRATRSARRALVNQRRWFIVVARLKTAEPSCSRFLAVSSESRTRPMMTFSFVPWHKRIGIEQRFGRVILKYERRDPLVWTYLIWNSLHTKC